ncbi:patatin-like phospholipase family protein [Actinospica durhamensis]|uniref:Patatin-like phospholipase family protein n=1 Tax=Actinospica durhamensis TaxID=1508375 RepID=A0A941EUI7_9ACTN|nr:patatin-like phospholipase family protein [Actinospica durhamensis]MBR7837488.1 patatin-like phospholipase family protein [Actinospica durhamensis]
MLSAAEATAPTASTPHPVLEAIADRVRRASTPGRREDGRRVVLAIEGGAMRGTISAGMALELEQMGVLPAFDAVYGSSAGAISATWLLSSRPEGLAGWAEPAYARALIRASNLLRRRPMVDVERLVEHIYREVAVLDFDSVLANPIELHPLATDAVTGLSVDLRPLLRTTADLRLAMRASSALPVLAGPAIGLGSGRYYDAGMAESVPYRTAIEQGATHILVLRSRVEPARWAPPAAPSRGARVTARTALRRESVHLRTTYLARAARLAEDDDFLAGREADPASAPAVLSIRPALEDGEIGKLTKDGPALAAALASGRRAARRALASTC